MDQFSYSINIIILLNRYTKTPFTSCVLKDSKVTTDTTVESAKQNILSLSSIVTTYTLKIYTQNKEHHYQAKKIDWRIKFGGEEKK